MISLVRFLEVRRMEGQKRQHGSSSNNPLNFVPEDEESAEATRRRSSLGIRSGILKDEAATAPGEDHSSYGYGEGGDCDVVGHVKSFKEYEDAENDGAAGAIPGGFGSMLGPGDSPADYRRQLMSQWNSESLSEYSEKYKRSLSSSAGAAAGTTEEEERRVRSRPDQASSVVLTNLLGGRSEETDLHMNISARTLRPSGGKDRHSKVFTAKGPRDRRVRLSVSTAIQFYDVQDRLGYDQPSKAVEWLMKKAKAAIDELSQIPLPGIDRLVPSSSIGSSMYHHHPYASYNPSSSMDQMQMSSHDHQVYNPSATSYSSGASELQLKGVAQEMLESSNHHHHQQQQQQRSAPPGPPTAAAAAAPEGAGGRSELQAVDESDGFTNRHAISGLSSSTRRGELATDITMSVGGEAPARSNQVQAGVHHHHHHHPHPHTAAGAAAVGLSSFTSPPLAPMMNTSLHHHRHQGLQLQQQQQQPRAAGYLYEDALANSAVSQRLLHHYNQQQQQASLMTAQQNYLQQQQQQEFFQGPSSGSDVLPFGMASPQAKPYLDQFHSLKIQTSGGSGVEKAGISSSASSSPGVGRFGSFLGTSAGVYSPQNLKPPPPQQQPEHSVGGFAAENSQLLQSLEEHLRGGNSKRD